MAEGSSNSCSLKVYEPEVEKYYNIVSVPPKSMLHLLSRSTGVTLRGDQFKTGILSKVHHFWTITFRPNQIRIRMDLPPPDKNNNRYILRPFHLALMSQNKVKSRHEMHFQSAMGTVLNSTTRWHASWMNDGSWDDTIDSVLIVVQASRELSGIRIINSLWYERSLQCQAALASYAERNYKSYFQNTDHADVTIFCRGKIFSAHKMVLSDRSPVFKKLFSQNLKKKEAVTINDFHPKVTHKFLKFMYLGELDFMGEALYNSLFDMANMYQVDALRMLCERQLTYQVTKDNCIEYFQKSVKMNAPLLKEKCKETIIKNCEEADFRNDKIFKIFFDEIPNLLTDLIDIVCFS